MRLRNEEAAAELSRSGAEERSVRLLAQMQEAEDKRQREAQRESLELARKLDKEEREESLKSAPSVKKCSELCSKEQVWEQLTPCERAAMGHVDSVAQANQVAALPALGARVKTVGFEANDLDACLAYIRDDAPILVHFNARTLNHPCKDPWCRSQFETGTSIGSFGHTIRKSWQDAMLSKVCASARKEERPKYGCLNITGDIQGVKGARIYGDFFITLAPAVRLHTSFANMDTGGQGGRAKMATNCWYANVFADFTDTELKCV